MDSDNRKRRLIAFGASEFAPDPGGFPSLPAAVAEIARIEKVLSSCGYETACTQIRLDKTADVIKTTICSFFGNNDLERKDAVALYFTGHGESLNGVHYLCPAGAHPHRLPLSAIKASDLAEWIYNTGNLPRYRRPGNLLLILDACWAGEAANNLLSTIAGWLRSVVPEGEGGIVILCAARTNDEAYPGALAQALEEVVEEDAYAPRQQRYLRVFELVDGINDRLTSQQARLDVVGSGGKQIFLLNPRFTPQYAGRSLEEAEWAAHWRPRAHGVETSDEVGDFFTGRCQALEDINAFLTSDGSEPSPLIVTGDPGSGKSAVLGRVVVSASPGMIDHKIHARRATTASIIERIAGAAAVSARTPKELVDAVGRSQKRLRIVVDALDEADNPPEIVADVLRPLAALPGVSVVIGTRRTLLDWLGRERIVDLDHEQYFASEDVRDYIERRLQRIPGSPYASDALRARAVAEAVAARAGHSFLVAAVHARSLAGRALVDPGDATWLAELQRDLGGAFEQDLQCRFGARSRLVRDVLRPLAFAGGRGIPQERFWADLSSRIANRPITNEQIDEVKRIAGFYVTPDVEDEVGVFRLYHERFAEHLRADVDAQSVHRAFVASLRSAVPERSQGRPSWELTRPYARRYLARHTAELDELTELIEDLAFVVHASPTELQAAVLRSPKVRRSTVGAIFLLAADRLQQSITVPGDRAEYLRLAALRQRNVALADKFSELDLSRRWRVVWTHLPMAHPHFVVGRHASSVSAVAFGWIDGDPVVVSGSWDRTVQLWDARSGRPRGTPLQGRPWVVSVSLAEIDGVPVVVSGSDDGTVRLWDARSGLPRRTLQGHQGKVTSVSLGEVDGVPVVVSGSDDGTVRLWDARSGRPRDTPLQRHGGKVFDVGLGKVDGVPVVVSGSDDGTVRLWDARSGLPRRTLQGHQGEVTSVSLGEVDGVPVVVSGSWDRTVQLWDARSGHPLGTPLQGHEGAVRSVSLGAVDEIPVVVSGSNDWTVRLWNARNGQPGSTPLKGHEGPVSSVSLGNVDGRPVVVSGGSDGTVRLWDATSEPRGTPFEGQQDYVYTVCLGEVDGCPVVASGSSDGTVRLWDARNGQLGSTPLKGHEGPVSSVNLGNVDGRPVVVSGGSDGMVRLWDARSGHPLGTPLQGHHETVRSVCMGEIDGTPVVVSGSDDGTVRLWDPRSGQLSSRPPMAHRDYVCSVRLGNVDGRPVVVSGGSDGMVRLWDARSGHPLGTPLQGHHETVRSVCMGEIDGTPVVVSGSDDGTVRLWDARRGHPLGTPLQGHGGQVVSVSMGQMDNVPVVASGGWGDRVCLWDARTGQLIALVRLPGVGDVCIRSDFRLLAVCSNGRVTMLQLLCVK